MGAAALMDQAQDRFDQLLYGLAKLSRYEIDEDIVAIYDMALAPFGYARVCLALQKIIIDRETRDPFPSVKDILKILEPKSDPETEAIEAVNRVISAISKYGWNNPERARVYIGELGWKLIEYEGGWVRVCETLTEKSLNTFRAQARQTAKAIQTRQAAGLSDQAPRIKPIEDKSGGGFQSVGAIIEQIEKKGE